MTTISIFEFIGLVIFCSAICLGFFTSTRFDGCDFFDELPREAQTDYDKPRERMILWWVRFYLGPIVGPYAAKPIYKCLPCMASLHSIIPTWIFLDYKLFLLPWDFFVLCPLVAFATAGLNSFIAYNYNIK